MSKYCEKDGKNRVEVAVELYTGKRKNACLSCKASEKIIAQVLKKGGETFGLTEEDIKKKFTDPYWIKGLSSTIRGVALFGVEKPFTPGAPFQIVWDVTYACNLHCKHCYATAGKSWKDELTTKEAKHAIDIFDRTGVAIIAFSGGECIVRPDILELTRYASDKGIYIAMATNGTLITKKKAREMKDAGVQFVQISLDGANAKTHDEFRGIKGAFDKTSQGIKNCVEEGFFTEVSTTVTKYNYKEIPDIVELSERWGADWFMAFNFVPTGRGKDILDMDITPDEREEMLKSLWKELKNRKINVLIKELKDFINIKANKYTFKLTQLFSDSPYEVVNTFLANFFFRKTFRISKTIRNIKVANPTNAQSEIFKPLKTKKSLINGA
jgi:MoaA/NifB/PqqE/SkfB family radical SAM enzyme